MSEIELPQYPQAFHNCNPKESGKPLCKLPTLSNDKGWNYTRSPQIMGCSLAELAMGRRDISRRNNQYDTFIVSDYPSREADQSGMPIWGDARNMLLAVLENSSFDPETTYITNHAKCAPPGRKAAAGEYTACRQHLEYELYKFKPSVVILMGAETLKVFNLAGQGGISSIHGEVYNMTYPHWDQLDEYQVMTTFHPKHYLVAQSHSIKNHIQEDFNKARSLLKDGVVVTNDFYQCGYQVLDTEEELDAAIEAILAHGLFAFDTESPGLDFMRQPMITLQMSIGRGKTWVLPFFKHDPNGAYLGQWKLASHWFNGRREYAIEKLRLIFENPAIAKAAHNIKYDMNVIRRHCGLITKGQLWDTQVMHHLLDVRGPHGLKDLADNEFFVGNYERHVRDIVGHGKKLICTFDNVPDHILHPYGANDAELTYRLLEVFYDQMQHKANLVKLYEEESMPAMYTLAEAEYNGAHLNLDNVRALGEGFQAEMDDLTAKCRELTQPDFNPGSTQQVAKALRAMGYAEDILDEKAASGYSTDKDTLLELSNDLPFADYIIKYRNRNKFLGTYVENALAQVGDDSCIRYGFNQTGTVSGRLSNAFFHQIPKSKDDDVKAGKLTMRDMIDEEDDFLIYHADYSQIELWVFALITGEQPLIDALYRKKDDPLGDVHTATAAGALLCEPHQVSKFNRGAVGKPLNFGVIYGSEGHALARLEYEDPFTKMKKKIGRDNALAFVRNFRQKHQKVDEYLTNLPDEARCRGNKVVTIFGREIIIPDLSHKDEFKRAAAERSATNVSIQSPAGAICIRTMNFMRNVLNEVGVGIDKVKLRITVHDSITYGVHKDYVSWFDETFRNVASRPIPELGGIQLPVESGWGATWAEAERNAK